MSKSVSTPHHHEAVEELLTIRASKWTVMVVLHLRKETRRFSELQREIGNISQKTLTSTLRALERDGFVSRTSYATIPPRVDYALTELGFEILDLFEAFERFASKHWHRVRAAREQFDLAVGEPAVFELKATPR